MDHFRAALTASDYEIGLVCPHCRQPHRVTLTVLGELGFSCGGRQFHGSVDVELFGILRGSQAKFH